MKKALKDLISSKDKRIKTNCIYQIYDIEIDDMDDEIKIDLFDESSKYKNLYIIKGNIFPTPKKKDFLLIKELYLKYDDNLVIKLFLEAEIIISKDYSLKSDITLDEIDLDSMCLVDYYKKLLNIETKLFSSVFTVKNNYSKFYQLFNYNDLKEYNISKKIKENLKIGQPILINSFNLSKNDEININELTMIKLLKEEEFINSVEKYMDSSSDIFKVIDIERNYLILINRLKKLFKLEKDKTNADLGDIIFIGHLTLKRLDNIFQLILINPSTYVRISKDEINDTRKISICYLSCIKFYIKDYKENNEFDIINISENEKNINSKEVFFIFRTYYEKNFDYFPITILLYHSKKDKNIHKKEYVFLLYQGILNKINLFLNTNDSKTYFYEYYYLDIYNILNIKETKLLFKDKKIIEIDVFDEFNSKNRKRINLMNVPQSKLITDKIEQNSNIDKIISQIPSNSIQICYLINNNTSDVFGIFNLNNYKIIKLKDNDYFNEYYDEFGNILDELRNNDFIIDNKEIVQKYIDKYKNSELKKTNNHLIGNFKEYITLSQYKTRLGFIICYYLHLKKEIDSFPKKLSIYLRNIDFNLKKKNIKLYKKLRIISFYLSEQINSGMTSIELHFYDDLNPNNPYTLAKDFNLNEINNLTEFSRLFFPYLQLDSYILYNYVIKLLSYSFSMEPLNNIKSHLKWNYEDFFFTTRDESDKLASQEIDVKITTINEKNLFNKEIYDEKGIIDINNLNESRNYALPISMEFRHEKNAHQKFAGKNQGQYSPLYFVRDLKFEFVSCKIKDIEKGESGWMIESFISTQTEKIKALKKELIYGELLDHNLFTGKNFDKLFLKMNTINQKFKPKDKNIETEKKYKDIKVEKPDKNNIEYVRAKKVKDILKKYEEQGIMMVGDVIFNKKNRDNITYYKYSELVEKPESKKKH